jgi:hypothetical protein
MSAAIWSGPTAFTQPAFGAQGKYKFKDWSPESVGKGFTSNLPYPTVGMDTSTGKREVDLQQQTKDAVPSIDPILDSYRKWREATAPFDFAQQQQAAELSSWLTGKQLSQLYPFLSAAGAESTARNLAASQAYRRFAEQLPSNVQNIMASKQAQMQSAQAGEADLMRATAAQQQAAKDFAGRFAGQYIQVG